MNQQQELQEKKERIEMIFQEAVDKLDELEKKRKKIILDYRKKIDQEKIAALQEELRK